MDLNPIVLKEFTQATRQRRTVVIRSVLPGLAVLIVLFEVVGILLVYWGEWHRIAGLCHTVFHSTSWIQLIAFPVLAVVYSGAGLRDEWTNRTMEVLCATPLRRSAIVYGTFACGVGKLFLFALTLLPVMGIWVYLGHVERSTALGTLGVIAAGTLLFAALTYVRAVSYRPGTRRASLNLDVLLIYLTLAILLGTTAWPGHPLLVAAVPYWSFVYVSGGAGPAGLTLGEFLPVALGVPAGVAALAILLAPLVFSRSFSRYLGARGGRGWQALVPARWRLGQRPPIRPGEDPFFWQERGLPTRALRWGLWMMFAVVVLVLGVIAAAGYDLSPVLDPASLLVLAWIGVAVMTMLSAMYGATVFAREKARRSSQALILTGHPPLDIYLSKLRSVYSALRYSYAAIAALVLAYAVLTEQPSVPAFATIGLVAPVAPLVATLVGLAFSAAARSPSQAAGGMVLAVAWAVLASVTIMMCSPVALVGAAVGLILMCTLVKVWTVWRLSFLAAFTIIFSAAIVGGMMLFVPFLMFSFGDGFEGKMLWLGRIFVGSAMLGLYGFFWFLFGLRIFERSMLNEAAKPGAM